MFNTSNIHLVGYKNISNLQSRILDSIINSQFQNDSQPAFIALKRLQLHAHLSPHARGHYGLSLEITNYPSHSKSRSRKSVGDLKTPVNLVIPVQR